MTTDGAAASKPSLGPALERPGRPGQFQAGRGSGAQSDGAEAEQHPAREVVAGLEAAVELHDVATGASPGVRHGHGCTEGFAHEVIDG